MVIDFSKYVNHLLALDPQVKIARVEPGIIRDDLNNTAEKHQLTFGPDPLLISTGSRRDDRE